MQRAAFPAVLIILGISIAAHAADGQISGRVNYCERGGILGMKVALSGREGFIYTSADGKFQFNAVPQDRYALFFSLGEALVHVTQDITVQEGQTTGLGEIAFCHAQASNGEKETPVAGSHCKVGVEDMRAIAIPNGEGICRDGGTVVKSCRPGFADCDARPDNGCETDLKSDNNHCGSCGNACPASEICVAGIC